MPAWLVRLPNGHYGRFSSIVDCFTEVAQDPQHFNDPTYWEDFPQVLERADTDAPTPYGDTKSETRWEQALRVIRVVHGEDKVKETCMLLGVRT